MRKQFVLRRRNGANKKKEENASKKGENSSSEQIDQQIEGEFVEERAEFVEEKAAATGLTSEEVEVAEMLVKAKNDTSKAKGVVINEGGDKKLEQKDMATDVKRKGKEKMIETDQSTKKQKMIESDETLAKKLQEEIDQAEKEQVEKDREIARALANELNEAFQKGLETEKAKQRAISLRKAMMARSSAKKRRPSQTYLATQERNKMITFLRSAIGVKKEMFIKMTFDQVKGLYEKEMGKLKNNEKDRVEFEKKAKERHDVNINKPFPESEEGTPTKEKAEIKEEETLAQKIKKIKRVKSIASKGPRSEERTKEEKKKEATLGQGQRILKRTKMMANRKRVDKKPRVEEEKKAETQEEVPQSSDANMYIVIMDKIPKPISAEPVGFKPPEVIHWDTMEVDGKEYIRLKRKDEKYEVYSTWNKIVRECSRSDLEEMFEVGMKVHADQLTAPGLPIVKLVMEYLCMLFKPEEVKHLIKDVFKAVRGWTLYERSGVYELALDTFHMEYYLVDRVYNHTNLKLHAMLNKKLGCAPNSEMEKYLIQRTINQSMGLVPNIGIDQ
ncbi:hypothetical protein L6452_34876 [Arctium lappa]|uniref:Uncharacterized protein n=1 Tax=Arctium lappa TaxID=4217 RepID=A0ACB8YJG7_ARCLA|nr:hypothetical protein L6452_34876 [Arctium lappa]